jgi:hypothetical protein
MAAADDLEPVLGVVVVDGEGDEDPRRQGRPGGECLVDAGEGGPPQ